MADISKELKQFKEAAYGENVRDAMISAISKINVIAEKDTYQATKDFLAEYLEKNPITKAALIASMNFEGNETVLWEGDEYYRGQTFTLSDDCRNYDYIDIYTYDRGQNAVKTFPSSCFDDQKTVMLRSTNVPDYGTSTTAADFQVSEMIIKIIATEGTIYDAEQILSNYNGSGVNTRVVVESTTTSTSVMHLRKIVGRMLTSNAEVEDLRNSALTTEDYESAGQAVRAQFVYLYNLLEAINKEVMGIRIPCDGIGAETEYAYAGMAVREQVRLLKEMIDEINAKENPVNFVNSCDPRSLFIANLQKGKAIDSTGKVVDSDNQHYVADVLIEPTKNFNLVVLDSQIHVGYAIYRSDTGALVRIKEPDESAYLKYVKIPSMLFSSYHYVYKISLYTDAERSLDYIKTQLKQTWYMADEHEAKAEVTPVVLKTTSDMAQDPFAQWSFANSGFSGDDLFAKLQEGIVPSVLVRNTANDNFMLFQFQHITVSLVGSETHRNAVFVRDCRSDGSENNCIYKLTINYDSTVTTETLTL